jgi:endoglucanase
MLPGLASLVLFLMFGLEGCQSQQPWPLWEAYTQRFIDEQGRVIDRSAGDRTTSEGQAYAMFFALVDNDRSRFDKLLDWTQANLAQGDLTSHLPAWEWGHTDSGDWKIRDTNSASDADVWLAYSLLEAGRLWKEPRYTALGRSLLARIATEEVVLIPGVGTTLAPGAHGFHTDSDHYILNPSYLPLPLLVALAREVPDGPWRAVASELPDLIGRGAQAGFAMDWIAAGPDGVHPSPPPSDRSAGQREAHAGGSYDAIRVYLWLGMSDPGTAGVRQMQSSLSGMANYLKSAPAPPLEVDGQGSVMKPDGPVGFSAAVLPYLVSRGMKLQARVQTDRMAALLDPATSLYGRQASYYDQNLALFSTGWNEERFRFERDGSLRLKWK